LRDELTDVFKWPGLAVQKQKHKKSALAKRGRFSEMPDNYPGTATMFSGAADRNRTGDLRITNQLQ
jgi:hypothetical protein